MLIVLLLPGCVRGQLNPRTSGYSREISMTADNDIFFFIDYYYTAGQDITYRRLINPRRPFYRTFHARSSDTSKLIVAWSGGFKIFNPKDIDSPDPKTMDRPYAGWSYVKYGITNFSSPTSGNRYEIEGGLVGPNSGMARLQDWVHKVTDFETPKGWASQIRNEVVINLYYTRYKEWSFARHAGVVSQSAVQAGTGGNKISQDFTLRTLRFNPINNSSFIQSRLSWDKPSAPVRKEAFFFFGAGVDYVLSNIFIQGSVFKGRASPFTVPITPVIIRETVGFVFSSKSVSWNVTAIHLSKEIHGGADHIYGSLGMAVRF